jgi:hypothetical protein
MALLAPDGKMLRFRCVRKVLRVVSFDLDEISFLGRARTSVVSDSLGEDDGSALRRNVCLRIKVLYKNR